MSSPPVGVITQKTKLTDDTTGSLKRTIRIEVINNLFERSE